jgi:hypothetical protein
MSTRTDRTAEACWHNAFSPPVPDRLLRREPFFGLYPLDGGGMLMFRQLFDTFDDDAIAQAILHRGALAEFGPLRAIDYRRFERWRSIEKSCFINRMYFLAPLAKRAWLRRDEKLAALCVQLMLDWSRRHPPPMTRRQTHEHIRWVCDIRDNQYNQRTHAQNQADDTDVRYLWFDFQPASRVIHWCYALHFLKRSAALNDVVRQELARSLHDHARVIAWGEEIRPLKPRDNHQSLRGVALLFAASALRGSGDWRAWADMGRRICRFHAMKDFLPDGMQAEISPSYHLFQLWHLRDAVALCRQLNRPMPATAQTRLKRATAAIAGLRQPDGCTPVINDGYAADARSLMRSLPAIGRGASARALVLPRAGLAVWRDRRRFALLDSSIFTGRMSHFHAGKNALTLWWDDQPVFIDSGCPSYDDPAYEHYKHTRRHSALLVDGQPDAQLQGINTWLSHPTVRLGRWRRRDEQWRLQARLTSDAPGWQGVSWRRELILSPRALQVRDALSCDPPRPCTLLFNCHPSLRVTQRGQQVILRRGSLRLVMSWDHPVTLSLEPGRCFVDFCHQANVLIAVSIAGPATLQTTLA